MLQTTRKDNSSKRRRTQLESLGTGYIAIRPCRNYSRTSKEYRVSSSSDKYLEYIRLWNVYDLAPLNTNKWRRLER